MNTADFDILHRDIKARYAARRALDTQATEMSQADYLSRIARLVAEHAMDFPRGPLTHAQLMLALRAPIVAAWEDCEEAHEDGALRTLLAEQPVPTLLPRDPLC